MKKLYEFLLPITNRNTKVAYERAINRFLEWSPTLPTGHSWVRSYQTFLMEKGLSNKTVNHNIVIVGKFYKFVNGERLLFDRLKEDRVKIDFLEESEIPMLLQACDAKFEPVARFMLDTGCRVGETSFVSSSAYLEIPHAFVITGKGEKQRVVCISEETQNHLKVFFRDGLVFGLKWSVPMIQSYLKKALVKSGIKKNIHPHTLRHTAATRFIRNGIDIREVKDMLGHANISTTEIYTHVTDERMREVWNKYHSR